MQQPSAHVTHHATTQQPPARVTTDTATFAMVAVLAVVVVHGGVASVRVMVQPVVPLAVDVDEVSQAP